MRITYKRFEPGMFIIGKLSRKTKSKIKAYLFLIKNTHCVNGEVESVYIKNIGVRKDSDHFIICLPKEEITSHIKNPANYFKGMKLTIFR